MARFFGVFFVLLLLFSFFTGPKAYAASNGIVKVTVKIKKPERKTKGVFPDLNGLARSASSALLDFYQPQKLPYEQ